MQVRILLKLLNNQLSLLIMILYLPNSFPSLLIWTRSLYYRHSNLRYPLSLLNLLVWTLKLSSQQSSQSSDEPSHSSSNSSEQLKHVADSHPLQPSQKVLHSSLSTQQYSSGPQSLFVFSPPSAAPEMPHATHSSAPPSSGWIPATSKSSDLELAAVASLASAELSISND